MRYAVTKRQANGTVINSAIGKYDDNSDAICFVASKRVRIVVPADLIDDALEFFVCFFCLTGLCWLVAGRADARCSSRATASQSISESLSVVGGDELGTRIAAPHPGHFSVFPDCSSLTRNRFPQAGDLHLTEMGIFGVSTGRLAGWMSTTRQICC